MSKFLTPEEQARNRAKAQKENNQRALTGINRGGRETPPTLTLKATPRYSEPADVISLDERRKRE